MASSPSGSWGSWRLGLWKPDDVQAADVGGVEQGRGVLGDAAADVGSVGLAGHDGLGRHEAVGHRSWADYRVERQRLAREDHPTLHDVGHAVDVGDPWLAGVVGRGEGADDLGDAELGHQVRGYPGRLGPQGQGERRVLGRREGAAEQGLVDEGGGPVPAADLAVGSGRRHLDRSALDAEAGVGRGWPGVGQELGEPRLGRRPVDGQLKPRRGRLAANPGPQGRNGDRGRDVAGGYRKGPADLLAGEGGEPAGVGVADTGKKGAPRGADPDRIEAPVDRHG